jgi:2-polyprenyl-3-methyl-5-hydroxy-6-metoxy-1,4-benzoquinol methylase
MSAIPWPAWHCPYHKKLLSEQDDMLCCPEGHGFLRRNHIPRFVSSSHYADAFGEQWKRYRLTQLDSYTKTTISKDRLHRCLGEPLWTSLEGKHVLECGCGAGRFTELLLERGASVTSVDLSDAVEANIKNCPLSSKHRISQADITSLPFAAQEFDVVLCLGVVQHTPSPEKTLNCLYDQVKPGGALVIDHYTWSLSWCTKTAPLIRQFAKRMRPENGIKLTEILVKVFYPLHLATRHIRLGQMVLSRISPVQFYGHAFHELSESLLREWALLDTHDSLTDWYKHFRTKGQILRTLTSLGLERIWCEYGGNGVEARGYRPTQI